MSMQRQLPARSVSMRQLPARTNSLVSKMRDSLVKFPSFNTKRTPAKPTSNHKSDELNVFASDIVSKEYLLGELKEVRHNPAIVKLEIEDLLVSNNHSSFLPVVKAILVTDERVWKYLRFVDTIAPSDILWWQGMKHILMREYETTIEEPSKYSECVSFQANIHVMEGATKKSIQSLIKTIQNDEDVQSVAFAGSLFRYSNDSVPDALSNLFDGASCLKDSFVLNVKCGWTSHGDHETCCCRVLKACQRALSGEDLLTSKLEAKLARGNRRPRRHLSGGDVSVASSTSASAHSTRSDGRRRRTARLSATADCPIIMQGDIKRSITLPAPAGNTENSSHSHKRTLPSKSSSFVIKRPSSLLDISDGKPAGLAKSGSRPLLTRRTKSFHHHRPTAESTDNKNYRWGNQESDASKDASPPRKPIRDGSSSSQAASPKPKMRRVKSLDKMALQHTEHAKKETPLPDYDWSKGNYVISSAA